MSAEMLIEVNSKDRYDVPVTGRGNGDQDVGVQAYFYMPLNPFAPSPINMMRASIFPLLKFGQKSMRVKFPDYDTSNSTYR